VIESEDYEYEKETHLSILQELGKFVPVGSGAGLTDLSIQT